MKKLLTAIVLVLLTFNCVSADLSFNSFSGDFSSYDPASSGIALSDIITVANYYGCKTWVKNECVECSVGYYFNKNGVCCEVPTLCKEFNRAEGLCITCYQGYEVCNASCVLAKQPDTGCAVWDGNVCTECSKGWWMNNGVCNAVSDQCHTWDSSNGYCLTCYGGYILQNGACIVNPNPFNGGQNALCGKWDGQSCLECSYRAYFNSFGVCTPVSDDCETWDPLDGLCLTCYGGHSLNNGVCIRSAIQEPSDPGCKTWNTNNNVCLECSHRYVFNGQKCVTVSDQCKAWDSNGRCTGCYDGYDLGLNGECVVSTRFGEPSDAGCGLWDWTSQICLKCSNNWVFNNQGICVPVSDQCKTYNLAGSCVSCYKGYDLIAGKCVKAAIQTPADEGCAKWNWDDKVCLECSERWAFNNQGICVPVSDHCQAYNLAGACTSCYKGYNLVAGACELAPTEAPSDVGCAKWNWNDKICMQCSNNWVFNNNGICVPVSDQCKTYNLAGDCMSCYDGYNLIAGKCQLAPTETPSDAGCGLWDWKNKRCLQCSNNWVFNNQGVCVPVSDQCKTYNLAGNCMSCYDGYNLVAGKCELAPTETPSDAGCGLWDWKNKRCLQCSNNWVFNNNGVCVPVSDQCKTYNLAGNCMSCYEGYNLRAGKCELAPIETPSDAGCGLWDWKNKKCLQCSNNWVFNNLGVCVPVSDQCKTYNLAGACVTCYKGYNLVAGRCEVAPIQQVTDKGCAKWNWDNQVCLQCSHRYVFNSARKCIPVNDNCEQWNGQGACTSCYAGYVLNNGICTQGNSLCKASNSNGACTTCYTGYILDNGSCVPISKLANLALYYSQCCPERLATLTHEIEASP